MKRNKWEMPTKEKPSIILCYFPSLMAFMQMTYIQCLNGTVQCVSNFLSLIWLTLIVMQFLSQPGTKSWNERKHLYRLLCLFTTPVSQIYTYRLSPWFCILSLVCINPKHCCVGGQNEEGAFSPFLWLLQLFAFVSVEAECPHPCSMGHRTDSDD